MFWKVFLVHIICLRGDVLDTLDNYIFDTKDVDGDGINLAIAHSKSL